MGLSLKSPDHNNSNNQEISKQQEIPANDFSDFEEKIYHMTKTDIQYSSSIEKKSHTSIAVKFIILVIALLIICISGKIIYTAFIKDTKDITDLVTLSESEIASKLGIFFADSPDEIKQVYQFSKNGKVTVRGNKDISIIYIDGKQVGVKFNTSEYGMFNMKIGDPEYSATNKMTYQYEDSFFVINDVGGKSDEYYYYNAKNNDCIIIIVSGQSNRIVAMTYYTDFKKISEELDFD